MPSALANTLLDRSSIKRWPNCLSFGAMTLPKGFYERQRGPRPCDRDARASSSRTPRAEIRAKTCCDGINAFFFLLLKSHSAVIKKHDGAAK